MFYLKPLIRKLVDNKERLKEIEVIGNDKDAIIALEKIGIFKEKVIETLEKHYGVDYVDIGHLSVQYVDIEGFDLKRMRQIAVLPYNLDKNSSTQYFAMSDVMNQDIRNDISRNCKVRNIKPVYNFAFDFEIDEKISELESIFVESPKETDATGFDVEKWVDEIIIDGISKGASDVHIESLEKGVQVRYRIDGYLSNKKIYFYENAVTATIMVRAKIIAGMDISEKRKPQDGRIDNFRVGTNLYDLRVSSVKTIFGEKIVMRIFNKTSGLLSFEQLGFMKDDTDRIKRLLSSKNGIIYMAGATGSGKTTTLYTMIDEVNRDTINIYTIEDPVEKSIKNVNQVQIDPLAGINYANTLRALLRQDPDVIIVGEIRDTETADLSIRASLTGHLVMATIHANNAIDSISRLVDMGVEPYLLGASSIAFISQRLVRTLCPYCKKKVDAMKEEHKAWLSLQGTSHGLTLDVDGDTYEAVGCSECNNGYKGRTAIIEIVEVTERIRELIKNKASHKEIEAVAISEGYDPLVASAIKILVSGKTSMDEIMAHI